MSLQNEDVLYLIWCGEKEEYKVGKLWRREKKYYFKYIVEEVKEAIEEGFELLEGFPRIDAEYFKEELFSAFVKHINIKGRKDVMVKEERVDEFKMLENLNKKDTKEGFYFKS